MAKCFTLVLVFSLLCFVYADNNDHDGITAGSQQFQFGQKVEQKALNVNYSSKLSFKYETTEKKSIGVYGKVFGRRTFGALRAYLTSETDAWSFNNYEPEGSNSQRTPDNAPWTNKREPEAFSHTKICGLIAGAVKHRMGLTEELYPYQVQGKIIRRGDHTLVAPDSNNTDEYSAIVFMNAKWHKNHYGELYFYNDAREIIAGVTPHGGRLVVWDSSILKLNRPPGVSFKQGQLLFTVIFSKSKDKMLEHSKQWHAFRKERVEAYKTWHLPDFKVPESIDISKHVVRNYTTKQDFKIFVFDDLFPREMLDHIRQFVLKYGIYFYDDSLDDDTSDNVQWIAGFPMQDYVKGAYWKIVKQVAAFVTGSKEYFPYDVSINLIRNADHTKIHEDCSPTEREWTFLLYLTPNWTHNYYGETVFLDRNSDDTDIAAEVLPKYGRACIFQGNIPHSARPPSLNFTGVRLSFASKLSETEFHGRRKNLVEELRHFTGLESQITDAGIPVEDVIMKTVNDIHISDVPSDILSKKKPTLTEEIVMEEEEEVIYYPGGKKDGNDERRVQDGNEREGYGSEDEGPEREGEEGEGEEGPEGEGEEGPEGDGEEGDERPVPAEFEGAPEEMQEEEQEHPPITTKFQTKLSELNQKKEAREVEDLYNKMSSIRTIMKAKSPDILLSKL